METKFLHQDIGLIGGMLTTETKSTIIFTTQREEHTTLITLGIRTSVGALKNQAAKLLHLLILILTFRVHIITMMIQDLRPITGTK